MISYGCCDTEYIGGAIASGGANQRTNGLARNRIARNFGWNSSRQTRPQTWTPAREDPAFVSRQASSTNLKPSRTPANRRGSACALGESQSRRPKPPLASPSPFAKGRGQGRGISPPTQFQTYVPPASAFS